MYIDFEGNATRSDTIRLFKKRCVWHLQTSLHHTLNISVAMHSLLSLVKGQRPYVSV